MENFEIELKGITKRFGQLLANDNAELFVKKGEIHALVGENGAGKTTLMKILYGLYTPDSGTIKIRGKEVKIHSSKDAIDLKIGMVHQHFMLVKTLTVSENVVLGKEITKNGFIVDYERTNAEVKKLVEKFNLSLDPFAKVSTLGVGEQQRLEILKLLYRDAEILIFDEPTAVLTPQETKYFFDIMKKLSSDGKTIILITHKLKEVLEISNNITVMRQGKTVGRLETSKTDEAEIAKLMVGRPVLFKVSKTVKTEDEINKTETVVLIKNLSVLSSKGHTAVNNLSLDIKKGEIFGIAGVEGNGQSELIETIAGLRKPVSGQIKIFGKDIDFKRTTPKKMFDIGLAHIPEDRHKDGLVLDFTVSENMILGRHREKVFSNSFNINFKRVEEFASKMINDYLIYPPKSSLKARMLSGGNQQKIVVARELSKKPRFILISQPTRGVDVGAIEFIHKKIIEARDSGCAILLISADLSEILSLSDRIGVIYRGEVKKIFLADRTNEDELGLIMMGGAS
ncbi:MAG: ABC transporter ATP-binding protein [Elusimicrobiales bacterium]|nr:ABC transporter ATP-binding protein [Elusimicrobiales bacterium]